MYATIQHLRQSKVDAGSYELPVSDSTLPPLLVATPTSPTTPFIFDELDPTDPDVPI